MGPVILLRPVSGPNRHVLNKCWKVVKLSQATVLGCPPWFWLRKRMVPRIFVDYHQLNSLTVKDAYPLPRIDDALWLPGNQQWFSAMDLASGYWQVAMSADAKRKAAFVTHEGLYQFRVMPFGLGNDPATLRDLWTVYCVACGGRGVWFTWTM